MKNIENEENLEFQGEVETVEEVKVEEQKKSSTVDIKLKTVIEWGFYAAGVILILLSINLYCEDLNLRYDGDIYNFHEKQYVGGDAYNYIISAARSSAVMVKSLIMALFGCSAIIIGRLTALINIMSDENRKA